MTANGEIGLSNTAFTNKRDMTDDNHGNPARSRGVDAIEDEALTDSKQSHANGPHEQGEIQEERSRKTLGCFSLGKTGRVHSDEDYTQDGSMDFHGNPAIKSKSGNWKACPFILGNECSERLAYYGMASNMSIFFTTKFHFGNSSATKANSIWSGTCHITPLIGAFLADSYLGRYWTIVIFSIVYFLGMTLLTLTATVPDLKPHCKGGDDCHVSKTQLGVFFLSLYLIALGTGGIKPCVSSFGADQFDETDQAEKKKKSSFFNWFYLSINIGALVASSVIVWIQLNIGWGIGFGVPAAAMGIAICSFLIGTRLYRHQKPGGSPLTRIAQVIVASFRKWHEKIPDEKSLLYEVQDKESVIEGSRKLAHTDTFLFFDKSAIETPSDKVHSGTINSWSLCTVTQVEEFKSIIRLLPICATGIIFAAAYSQMSNLFVLLGQIMNVQMGPRFKIPSAALGLFDTLSVILWVPIYDRMIVPFARKYTGHPRGFTQLQRMGIGLAISIFSMVVAAIVEIKRLEMAREHKFFKDEKQRVDMSIFWQIPQYFLIGVAEVFTFVGQLDFFYDQAPDAMRSLCSALQLTTVALGNYLSSLLVTIVVSVTARHGKNGWIPEDNLNNGHVDYFFWLLAILSFINLLVFIVIAEWYTYKRPTGEVHITK